MTDELINVDEAILLAALKQSWGQFRERQHLGGMDRDAFAHYALEAFADKAIGESILQAIQSSGTFMVVPVEPTEAMIARGAETGEWHDDVHADFGMQDSEAHSVYKAMLDACK